MTPIVSFGLSEWKNFIFGAHGNDPISSQKGGKAEITIVIPQSFTITNEDHNLHLEVRDSAGSDILVGYFVNQDNPSTAFGFAEIFPLVGDDKQWMSLSSIGNNNDVIEVGFHRSASSWSYFIDGNLVFQDSSTSGTSFNTSNLKLFAEKICPNPNNCNKNQGGSLPSVNVPIAMQYTASTTFSGASWTDMKKATAYYEVKDSMDAPTVGDVVELCLPMTMKGIEQDSTLGKNQLIIGNNVHSGCPDHNQTLWLLGTDEFARVVWLQNSGTDKKLRVERYDISNNVFGSPVDLWVTQNSGAVLAGNWDGN